MSDRYPSKTAPKSTTTGSPAPDEPVGPGRAWGLAEFSPDATIVSKALSSAPRWRMAWSRAAANRDSVSLPSADAGRGQQGEHRAQRLVGDGRGPLHPGHLAGVLDQAQALDHPPGGDQLGPSKSSSQDALARPGDVVRLQAHRPTAPAARHQRLPLDLHPADAVSTSAPTPAAGQLLGAWVRYRPSVVSRARVPGDQQQPGRAGEPGQPPDVGRRGHQQARRRPPSSGPAVAEKAAAAGRGGRYVERRQYRRRTRGAHRSPAAGRRGAGRPPRRPVGSPSPRTRRCSRRPPGRSPTCAGTARGPPGWTGGARPPRRRRRPGRRGATTRCGRGLRH